MDVIDGYDGAKRSERLWISAEAETQEPWPDLAGGADLASEAAVTIRRPLTFSMPGNSLGFVFRQP